jgi:hypothetical protein
MVKSLFILSLLVVFGCAHKKTDATATAAAPAVSEAAATPAKGTKAAPAKAAKASSASVNCTSNKETRTIAVVAADGGGCETVYSKGTNVQSVANAKTDMSYCETKLNQIRDNLQKSGWKCE